MILIQHCRRIVVLQVGCGGTGSWLVPLVSKLLNNIKLRLPEEVEITYKIIDDDVVEQRNILRQNFNEWDIGKGKALSLVTKYCYNFKNMEAIKYRMRSKNDISRLVTYNTDYDMLTETLVIILGCVDNNKSRQLINRLAKGLNKDFHCPVVYMDSGNLLYNGQIVTLSYGFNGFVISNLSNEDQEASVALFRQLQKRKKINFNKMFPSIEEEGPTASCAFFGDQSQAINSLAATILFCNLQRILVSSEIPPEIITFNSSGYSTFEV